MNQSTVAERRSTMADFEVIHIDGVGTIRRATQSFIKKDKAQCAKDHICWFCRDTLKHNQGLFYKDLCRQCEADQYGD